MSEVHSLEFLDPPEGLTPLEGILLVRALDEDGDVVWYSRKTDGLYVMEGVGMLEVMAADWKNDVIKSLNDE